MAFNNNFVNSNFAKFRKCFLDRMAKVINVRASLDRDLLWFGRVNFHPHFHHLVYYYKQLFTMRSMNSKPAGYPRSRLFTPNPPGFWGVFADKKKTKRVRQHRCQPIDFSVGCILFKTACLQKDRRVQAVKTSEFIERTLNIFTGRKRIPDVIQYFNFSEWCLLESSSLLTTKVVQILSNGFVQNRAVS